MCKLCLSGFISKLVLFFFLSRPQRCHHILHCPNKGMMLKVSSDCETVCQKSFSLFVSCICRLFWIWMTIVWKRFSQIQNHEKPWHLCGGKKVSQHFYQTVYNSPNYLSYVYIHLLEDGLQFEIKTKSFKKKQKKLHIKIFLLTRKFIVFYSHSWWWKKIQLSISILGLSCLK